MSESEQPRQGSEQEESSRGRGRCRGRRLRNPNRGQRSDRGNDEDRQAQEQQHQQQRRSENNRRQSPRRNDDPRITVRGSTVYVGVTPDSNREPNLEIFDARCLGFITNPTTIDFLLLRSGYIIYRFYDRDQLVIANDANNPQSTIEIRLSNQWNADVNQWTVEKARAVCTFMQMRDSLRYDNGMPYVEEAAVKSTLVNYLRIDDVNGRGPLIRLMISNLMSTIAGALAQNLPPTHPCHVPKVGMYADYYIIDSGLSPVIWSHFLAACAVRDFQRASRYRRSNELVVDDRFEPSVDDLSTMKRVLQAIATLKGMSPTEWQSLITQEDKEFIIDTTKYARIKKKDGKFIYFGTISESRKTTAANEGHNSS